LGCLRVTPFGAVHERQAAELRPVRAGGHPDACSSGVGLSLVVGTVAENGLVQPRQLAQVQLAVEHESIDALQRQSSSAAFTNDSQDRLGVAHLAHLLTLIRRRRLPPFTMCRVFPGSDYYGGSVALGLAPRRRSRIPCDEGIGIAAADLPHIFERFYRGQNVAQVRGFGIGLAASRAIVEQHGGSLVVETTGPTGSTFLLRLPLHAPP
jgi:Histidine kinase-, DNA gyrase B-, and HSP90-like ATPase